jgi:geranylgeranyl diphosphate synthase type I
VNGGAPSVPLRERINAELDEFLAGRGRRLAGLGEELGVMLDALAGYTSGGKLLRPTFCYWGWRGAGGSPEDRGIIRAVVSLELLHASALIHDDVMDASDRRRGQPTAHRRFEAVHRDSGWHGSAERFGAGAAILLGDLCLAWSDEALRASGLPADAVVRALELFEVMRSEVIAGQYLDLSTQAMASRSIEQAMRVIRAKSARYTVERPLQVGSALAGGDQTLAESFTAYGVPVGEAFQLRDDLLGVFGNPERTGKPAGDDLREGKRTVLLAYAYEAAGAAEIAVLDRWIGDATIDQSGVDEVRGVLVGSGALDRVEQQIATNVEQALRALEIAPLHDEGTRDALGALAIEATDRQA